MSSNSPLTLDQLDAAPAWARSLGGGDPYSLEFQLNGGNYLFVPQSVVNNGVSGGGYTTLFPYFLDQGNQEQFLSNAQSANLDNQSWMGDYLKNHGLSTTGYFVKSDLAPFDSSLNTYNTDEIGAVRGIGKDDNGNDAYILAPPGHQYGYINNLDGIAHRMNVTPGRSILGDILGDTGESIAGTIRDIGSSINSLGPLGTAALAAFSPLAATALQGYNTGAALQSGAPLSSVAENLAANYAGSQIGAEVGANLENQAAGQLAGSTASGVLKGQDVGTALTNAALSTAGSQGGGALNQAVSDAQLAEFARQQAELADLNAKSPNEQDVLAADPSIQMNFPLSTPPVDNGRGDYNQITGEWVPDPNGTLPGPLTDASGTNIDSMNGYEYNPDTKTWTSPNGETYDLSYLPDYSGQAVSGSDLLAPPSEDTAAAGEFDPTRIPTGLATSLLKGLIQNDVANAVKNTGQVQTANNTNIGGPKLMAGKKMTGDSTGDPYYLEKLHQLYGSLTPNMPDQNPQTPLTMATGGSTDSSTSTDNPFPVAQTASSKGPFIGGGQRKVAQLAPLQQLKQQISQPRMAHGGALEKYKEAMPEGHKPEFITGLTGYYASGRGTGQSDDIDAMLHDGDYVADADLVAALGDGSSKAGAEALEKFRRQVPHQEHAEGGQPVAAKIADGEYVFPASFVTAIGKGDNKAGAKILDKMREAIRSHKRSAPTTKIPPKAKSPLEYLKMVKG